MFQFIPTCTVYFLWRLSNARCKVANKQNNSTEIAENRYKVF